MKSKFKFLLLYLLGWVVLFDLLRLAFFLYQFEKTRTLSFSTILSSFWQGMRMDISMASYILLPVCLLVIASVWVRCLNKLCIYRIYTAVILFIVLLISLCDLEIYRSWGFRIDATPLKFLTTPREVYSSISHLPLLLILGLFATCYILLLLSFRFYLNRIHSVEPCKHKVFTSIVLLLFTGSLIIPIRGGLQQAPLNQSSVYFSTNTFANHAAINACWNFMHGIIGKGNTKINPYQYFSDNHEKVVLDSLYSGVFSGDTLIRFSDSIPTNVIVIIWESLTEKALHVSIDGKEVMPGFNRWKKEGVYFSNVYASGDRTNKGIPAVLSGYPAMPNTSIIHSPGKSGKIQVLSQLFKDKGYNVPFFYGGEPEFANIKSYLLHGGFDPIIGRNDFSSKDMNSKWGAHDGVVMNRFFDSLNAYKKPFFATWLTLSSHEPYETPIPVVFPGDDFTSKFLNSLNYSDQCVTSLIDKCSKQPWWNNTVMIIIGDHGHPLPQTNNKADEFRTPMLWLGGAVAKKGLVIDKVVSQLDIAATLAQQAGMKTDIFPYSKNILDQEPLSWAFFTFNDGFGFVNAAGRVVYDNVGKQPILIEGNAGEKEINAGKAMQQATFGDFISK